MAEKSYLLERKAMNKQHKIELIKSRRKAMKSSGHRIVTRKKTPRPIEPRTIERSYYKAIITLLIPAFDYMKVEILRELPKIVSQYKREVKIDVSYGEIISIFFQGLYIGVIRVLPNTKIAATADEYANRTSDFNRKEQDRIFKTVLGINPMRTEPYLTPMISAFTENNVGLISSIVTDAMSKTEQAMRRELTSGIIQSGVEEGISTKKLANELLPLIDIENGNPEKRAQLIARDQISKFNGALTQVRQEEVGIEKYIWSTSMDERVRPSHESKEGLTFSWDNPPVDTGAPGFDINCRCVALPILDDFKEVESEQ